MANGGRTSKGKCATGLFEIYQPTDFEGDEEGKIRAAGRTLGQCKGQKVSSMGAQFFERASLDSKSI